MVIIVFYNLFEYNGIKFFELNGMGLKKEREVIVEELFFSEDFYRVKWNEIGELRKEDIIKFYIEVIKNRVDVEVIKKRRFFVVVDIFNGVGSLILFYLLREFGCKVVFVNVYLDGYFFVRNFELNEENFKGFMEIVKVFGVDFGVV